MQCTCEHIHMEHDCAISIIIIIIIIINYTLLFLQNYIYKCNSEGRRPARPRFYKQVDEKIQDRN